MGSTLWCSVRATLLSGLFCLVTPCVCLAEDLLASLDLAWSQDPVLQSALQAHQTSLTRIPQAKASLLPVVNLSAQSSFSNGGYVFSGAEQTDRPIRTTTQTLQLTQALYRPQQRQALVQAELQAVQTLAQLNQAEQELMLRLLQAYVELQSARNHQDVLTAQVKLQAQHLLVVERGLTVGTHAQPDVDEARSKYATALAQVVDAATQWRIKRQELLKMTGEAFHKGGNQWNALSDDFSLEPWVESVYRKELAEWMEQARIDAPAVRAQMAAVEIALREILKNRAAHLPTLDFTASHAYAMSTGSASSAQNFDSSSRVTQYGLQLTVPVYAGGGTSAKVRESVAAWSKAEFDQDAAQQQVESAVLNAFESIEAARAQIRALQVAIDAAQLAVQGNLTGVRVGKRTLLHVYESELQLATAQRDWRKARYDLMVQVAKLKASVGLLEREDFIALNGGFRTPPPVDSMSKISPIF